MKKNEALRLLTIETRRFLTEKVVYQEKYGDACDPAELARLDAAALAAAIAMNSFLDANPDTFDDVELEYQ